MAYLDVVIPAWNPDPAWLRQAVGSCLLPMVDGRVIVVDDGSDDPSFLHGLPDDPRIVVRRAKHGGVCRALDAGLGLATAEWVMRLDADDACWPSRPMAHARELAKEEKDRRDGCAITCGSYATLDGTRVNPDLFHVLPRATEAAIRRELAGHCAAGPTGPARFPMPHPCWMLRRRAWADMGGYEGAARSLGHEGVPLAEDLWLLAALLLDGRPMLRHEDIVTTRRLHPGRVSLSDVAGRAAEAREAGFSLG